MRTLTVGPAVLIGVGRKSEAEPIADGIGPRSFGEQLKFWKTWVTLDV